MPGPVTGRTLLVASRYINAGWPGSETDGRRVAEQVGLEHARWRVWLHQGLSDAEIVAICIEAHRTTRWW